jgi:pimeloyl-[acyl-carrier protein] methyl ester esterase
MTLPVIETLGQGPDLVFLHGWGMNRSVFRPAIDGLAEEFTLHLVDLPGFGESPAIEPFTLETVASLLDRAFSGREVSVCGWSLGGQVAMTWALRSGQSVRRLVLAGSTPCFVRRSDWPHGLPADVFLEFARDLEQDYRSTLLRFLSLQARGDEAVKSVLANLRSRMNSAATLDARVLRAWLDILLNTDLRLSLSELRIPVLVLHGAQDTLCPPGAAQWASDELPNADLYLFPRAGHAPFLSSPREFAARIRDFLHG